MKPAHASQGNPHLPPFAGHTRADLALAEWRVEAPRFSVVDRDSEKIWALASETDPASDTKSGLKQERETQRRALRGRGTV